MKLQKLKVIKLVMKVYCDAHGYAYLAYTRVSNLSILQLQGRCHHCHELMAQIDTAVAIHSRKRVHMPSVVLFRRQQQQL